MFSEWCYYSKAFTKDECEEIVRLGKSKELGEGVLGDGNHGGDSHIDLDYRRSNLRFIDEGEPGAGWIFDKMWKKALICNREWFKLHLEQIESFQFTEYKGDEEKPHRYKEHADVFWVTENPYHRKLSAVLQLAESDAYQGGELRFSQLTTSNKYPTEQQEWEMRQQGSLIFFPSFVRHRVEPVTSGLRHSLVVWIDGPKWR